MKYRIEISEESLRIIGLAVDEYMRLRMGQFDALAEDLAYDGIPRVKTLTGKYTYDTELQKRCSNIKNLFETAYKMAFPLAWPPWTAARFMGNVYRPCTRHRAPAVAGQSERQAGKAAHNKPFFRTCSAGA